jgi:hypothetical protein
MCVFERGGEKERGVLCVCVCVPSPTHLIVVLRRFFMTFKLWVPFRDETSVFWAVAAMMKREGARVWLCLKNKK